MSDSALKSDRANDAMVAAGILASGVASELVRPLRELREGLAELVEKLGFWAQGTFQKDQSNEQKEDLTTTLAHAVAARAASIRLYTVAASGVATTAEYLMRIASVITQSRYLFLTDDSGVGNEHAEPTVPCYVVTRLDQLLTRVIASELRGVRVEPEPDEIIRTSGIYDAGVCEAPAPQAALR